MRLELIEGIHYFKFWFWGTTIFICEKETALVNSSLFFIINDTLCFFLLSTQTFLWTFLSYLIIKST